MPLQTQSANTPKKKTPTSTTAAAKRTLKPSTDWINSSIILSIYAKMQLSLQLSSRFGRVDLHRNGSDFQQIKSKINERERKK